MLRNKQEHTFEVCCKESIKYLLKKLDNRNLKVLQKKYHIY